MNTYTIYLDVEERTMEGRIYITLTHMLCNERLHSFIEL